MYMLLSMPQGLTAPYTRLFAIARIEHMPTRHMHATHVSKREGRVVRRGWRALYWGGDIALFSLYARCMSMLQPSGHPAVCSLHEPSVAAAARLLLAIARIEVLA